VLENSRSLQPSPLVKKFAPTIAEAASGYPIIDVACGAGRNAFYLAEFCPSVICVDRDLTRLRNQLPSRVVSLRLTLFEMDLLEDPWPFGSHTIGGIVLVDFLDLSLFALFERSLIEGGYLLIETVSGRGGNYLELPKASELRMVLEKSFDFRLYREVKVGPRGSNAVTVRLLARRRASSA
jgi:SAM-dependent methyltransferase